MAWHGLYELARDALMAVPAPERDFHIILWSADTEAHAAVRAEGEELGRWLAAFVRKHAGSRDSRVHLLMNELVPLTEVMRPPGERLFPETGPHPLPARPSMATDAEKCQDLSPEGRPCLYLHLEFAPWARAWVAWRERIGEPHSYTWLGDRMKSARSLAYELVTGTAKLLPRHVPALVRAFDLTKDEQTWLEGMARYSISVDLLERARERQALIAFAADQGVRTWEGEQFTLASHWAPLAICTLASLPVFRDNPAWISCALRGRICWQDVRDMMSSLLAVGRLQPRPGGPPRPAVIEQSDPEGVPAIADFAFHESVFRLLQMELQFPTPDQRLRACTFALPDRALPALWARYESYKTRAENHLRASDARAATSPPDRVLLCASQLFPLSLPLVNSLVLKVPRP